MLTKIAPAQAGIALPLRRNIRADAPDFARTHGPRALPSRADMPIGPEMDVSDLRVALFSPMPPRRSGIADYSHALAQELGKLVTTIS